jgi:hypothetical protein
MTKIIISVTLFLMSLISLAQVSENRTVGRFTKLQVAQSIQVFYTISDKISVNVETDDAEKMAVIKTEVVGETLKLFIDTEKYAPLGKKRKNKYNDISFKVLKINISGPNLNEIKASSSAKVKVQNLNKTTNISLTVSSSGKIQGNFESDNLTIEGSSSGKVAGEFQGKNIMITSSSSSNISLEGKAVHLKVNTSSSGECNLEQLQVLNAEISASSSSFVSVHVTKALDAEATSSANIKYAGNPAQVTKESNSSGSISQQ